MRNSLLTAALVAVIASVTGSQALAFSDLFGTSQPTSTNNTSSGFDTGSTLMTGYGSRTIQTFITANSAPGDARGRTAILNGAFSYSSDDGVAGSGYLTYAFSTPISLTLSPVFSFVVASNDDTGTLGITLYNTNGASATISYPLPALAAGSAPVTITVPANFTGINSAAVSKAVFSFGGTTSEDLSLSSIATVPEPGTLGMVSSLVSLAGAGLLTLRRRRA